MRYAPLDQDELIVEYPINIQVVITTIHTCTLPQYIPGNTNGTGTPGDGVAATDPEQGTITDDIFDVFTEAA